jgi:hypothetical protein
MNEHLHAVTRIRGEFLPTEQVKIAINRFLEVPVDPDTIKLYTTAQVVVDTLDFRTRQYKYKEAINQVEGKLSKKVLSLTGATELRDMENGGGFLLLPVSEQPFLNDISNGIHKIDKLERDNFPNMLVFEIARGALAADSKRRQERCEVASQQMQDDARDPQRKFSMKAVGSHVVTRDIAVNPANRRLNLPGNDRS